MIIQTRYILLVALVFFALFAHAQYRGGGNAEDYKDKNRFGPFAKKGEVHVRWYPFGLINTADMNITFGAEYVYAANRSISLDAGYIFDIFDKILVAVVFFRPFRVLFVNIKYLL